MTRNIYILLVLLLSGCASTQNEKVTQSKVGVLTPVSHNNQFCYLYNGLTVFNNESNIEMLEPNFSESYEKYVWEGIKKSGNTPVILGALPVDKIHIYFNRKEWDHSITVTEEGQVFLKNLGNLSDVDYILFPWLYDEDRCMVSATLSNSEYALDSNIQLHLFEAKSLKHMQSRQVNSINSTRPQLLLSDITEPSKDERFKLSLELFKELEDDVFRLLEGDCCYFKRTDLP